MKKNCEDIFAILIVVSGYCVWNQLLMNRREIELTMYLLESLPSLRGKFVAAGNSAFGDGLFSENPPRMYRNKKMSTTPVGLKKCFREPSALAGYSDNKI